MCVSFLPIFDSPGPKETHNHAMHTHIPEMSFAFIHHSSLSLCVSSANTLFCSLQDGMEAELMGLTTEDLETKARLLSNQSKVCRDNRKHCSAYIGHVNLPPRSRVVLLPRSLPRSIMVSLLSLLSRR